MRIRVSIPMIFLLAVAAPAAAVSTRVFVNTAGVDSGTCAIASPCRTFAYAITQVGPGGEVIAQNTGGYGPVTISQAQTIIAAPGATAFVAAGATGITVAAGASDVVTVRGLAITAQGGTTGIDFQSGQRLDVENCLFIGFTTAINFVRSGDASQPRLNVVNCVVRNSSNGVYIANSGASTFAYATVSKSSFTGNGTAVFGADNSRVAVSDTVVAASTTAGVLAAASADGAPAQMMLERSTITRNATGVNAGSLAPAGQNLRGVVRLSNCTVAGNDYGVVVALDGQAWSRVANLVFTNTIAGNLTDIQGVFGSYAAQ